MTESEFDTGFGSADLDETDLIASTTPVELKDRPKNQTSVLDKGQFGPKELHKPISNPNTTIEALSSIEEEFELLKLFNPNSPIVVFPKIYEAWKKDRLDGTRPPYPYPREIYECREADRKMQGESFPPSFSRPIRPEILRSSDDFERN